MNEFTQNPPSDPPAQPPVPASNPQDDRLAALEARLAQVTGALSEAQQREQVRAQQTAETQQRAQWDQRVSTSETAVQSAQRSLTAAYESGDSQAISQATAALSMATAELTAAKVQREAFVEEARSRAQQAQQQPQQPPQRAQQQLDDTNLRQWRQRNQSWYGVDPEMTQATLEIDREIRSQRVLEVGSQQYFNAIDARLRARFPDKFQGTQQPAAAQFQQQRAPAATTPQQGSGETRIPAAIADSYRRMGFDMDDPKVVQRLVASRGVAVQKGILPENYVTDRAVQR